ncbi:hypothetical protein M0657_001107 [Pyricularia oryzae]|uniref:Uncharacterized protein n=2 Tax=Pyricularia oryzae TaxID=318829 RepID=A0AA97PH99_PYRO3|nr:hypothetical protein OOU_Y34scaffold00765g68 [Pyricularia oryzae Y34]KAI7931609.1 hypothetical protein M0657_001107 [Pyricularia oryzae]
MLQRPTRTAVTTGVLLSPTAPTPRAMVTSSTTAVRRPSLPSRHAITNETIGDAYVSFIFYCNPAVPPSTDSSALKEAFWLPPKSEGKTFSTFTLYELIGKLNQRDEVKTWGDLALRLGVERPKAEKQQSAQKIQQYAVRLKRWMKSMHVDAFFNYLYGEENEYFTDIPPEGTPITDVSRDGVAPEDDMALRALLPHIRPRRGRRARDDDESGESPAKVARIEMDDCPPTAGRTDAIHDPWSALPGSLGGDLRNVPGASNQAWTIDPPPLSAHPRSAITPSTKAQFWADEPKSAITPSRTGRTGHKRHGPKVVSSAWKSGQGTSGKTRGRPPNSRMSNNEGASAYPMDTPISAAPNWPTSNNTTDLGWGRGDLPSTHDMLQSKSSQTPPAHEATPPTLPALNTALSIQDLQQQPYPQPDLQSSSRPLEKPKGLSLHVPERVGNEVRLATPPPPTVTVNGQSPAPPVQGPKLSGPEFPQAPSVRLTPEVTSSIPPPDPSTTEDDKPKVCFKDPSNRTNMDELEGFFAHEIMTGIWRDKDGNRIPSCSVDEAFAIVRKVIQSLLDAAITEVGFMLNVSALAGGKVLMTTSSLQITVVEEREEETLYSCKWLLQLGDLKGDFEMQETVRHDTWRKPADLRRNGASGAEVSVPKASRSEDSKVMTASESQGTSGGTAPKPRTNSGSSAEVSGTESADYWKEKYREVAEMYKRKDKELARMQSAVMKALQDPRADRL